MGPQAKHTSPVECHPQSTSFHCKKNIRMPMIGLHLLGFIRQAQFLSLREPYVPLESRLHDIRPIHSSAYLFGFDELVEKFSSILGLVYYVYTMPCYVSDIVSADTGGGQMQHIQLRRTSQTRDSTGVQHRLSSLSSRDSNGNILNNLDNSAALFHLTPAKYEVLLQEEMGRNTNPLLVDELTDVPDRFVYLDSCKNTGGLTRDEITSVIWKSRAASLANLWYLPLRSNIPLTHKSGVYIAVIPVVLFMSGCVRVSENSPWLTINDSEVSIGSSGKKG
ncbi:hypothetical protein CLF_100147 [Clonorchis sinensis]|uniref:Uncharacterized protein n=1 Tax=Clonorchis sinensis TaxID=79923 RepID=H2KNH1_CLOSI|nr:hypothetical protein CLF_100147 [Clonorchis sinensis]